MSTYAIPYIVFIFLLLLFSVNCKETSISGVSLFQKYSITIICFIFIGLRAYIYTDFASYYNMYTRSPTIYNTLNDIQFFSSNDYFAKNIEKGFIFYVLFLKSFSDNYFFYQIISYIIETIILYYALSNYLGSKYWLLGLAVFYVFEGFGMQVNLHRNIKSILIFLLSIKYIRERKFKNFILLNFIGLLFHTTALLYFPLYFISTKKFNRKMYLAVFIFANIIYLFQIQWLIPILKYISTNFSGSFRFFRLLTVYLKSNKGGYGLTIGYIERFFSFLLILYFSPRLIKQDQFNVFYIKTFCIYIFVRLFCSEFSVLMERISILFIFSYWFLYPRLYMLLNKKQKSLFLWIFSLYSLLKFGYGNRTALCSYENILLPHGDFEERVDNLYKILLK